MSPTGYTADIYDGKDVKFEDFALRCARAFMPLVMMRDDPMDAPIPDGFAEGSYYTPEKVRQAKAEIAKVMQISDEDLEQKQDQEFLEETISWHERSAEQWKIRRRYEAMLKRAEAWRAPTPEHEPLKKYMIEQLKMSIENDCRHTEYETAADDPYGPRRMTVDEYRQLLLDVAKNALESTREGMERERTNAESRTAWIKALKDSLGVAPNGVVR